MGTVRKGNSRRKTTFAKARGFGSRDMINQCTCSNCKRSPYGMDEVVVANKIRKLNAARTESSHKMVPTSRG